MPFTRWMFALTAAGLAAVSTHARGESRDEVVARHTSSVESLQSLTCKIRIEDNHLDANKKVAFGGEYTRFGDRVKCTTRTDESTDVYVAENGLARVFKTRNVDGGTKAYAGAVTPVTRYRISPCEPFSCGLLHLSLPNTIEYLPLAALVAKAKSCTLAPDESVGGLPCAKISLVFECDPTLCTDRWTVDLWLSRKHGMLVKKCRYDAKLLLGQRQLRESEVTEFVAAPSGAWFPKGVRYTTSIDGALSMTREVAFEGVATPSSLPNEAFAIKFHKSTPLTDHLRHTVYTVDESGKRISPEKPLGVAGHASESAAKATSEPEARTDTVEEPRRFLHVIVIGVSITTLAGTLLYNRRRRRKADGP